MSAAALVAGESTISEGADIFEGEHVLFRAALSERWQAYRAWEGCCFGTWLGCSITALPIFGLPYLWCGQSLRRAEADTFSLILTTSAIHFHQKRYDCAWCCQTTTSKTIPLDKIQVGRGEWAGRVCLLAAGLPSECSSVPTRLPACCRT